MCESTAYVCTYSYIDIIHNVCMQWLLSWCISALGLNNIPGIILNIDFLIFLIMLCTYIHFAIYYSHFSVWEVVTPQTSKALAFPIIIIKVRW